MGGVNGRHTVGKASSSPPPLLQVMGEQWSSSKPQEEKALEGKRQVGKGEGGQQPSKGGDQHRHMAIR